MDIDINSATPTGEGGKVFSAKDVIDQIPKTDDGGRPIPEWKRQIMARKAAEQATKEAAENMKKKKEEEQENKYKNLPAWKADLLRKKEEAAAQERKEEEERKRRLEEDRQRAARLEKERKKQNRSGALKPWEKEIQKAREGSEEQYV
uniref:Espin-like n=1 Tax=Saccoglossus kowalevskii TaxID=10224 RepID=A0ABM0MRC1_SACKO|nr:PREDICTED: espin-like [Saccoglossus kowalevskii]